MSDMRHTLHGAVFAASERWAQRPAVVDERGTLSYAELGHRAQLAAAHLQRVGVHRGARVAILAERGADSIVAMLGTLLLGAIYVPFDSRWPPRRKIELLHAISPAAIVAGERDADGAGTPTLTSADLAVTGASPALPATATAHDPAYILYTSGTTGTPKGVTVSHRAARYFVDWTRATFALQPDDRIAGVSSFTFDLSIFDIFATLASGATLCLYDHRKTMLASSFARFLERERISIVYTVPTALTLLAAKGQLHERDLGALRTVLFAGEPFAWAPFEKLRRALPARVEYYNLYGPTETNVCTAYRVTGRETAQSGLPIGQPLPGTRLVPVRSEAAAAYGADAVELWVYGPSVMSGYWGDERSAGLVHDTATECAGYRTGDVCRLDGNGDWVFLGRADNQLKVNGFRVSAEEIEETIASDPDVLHCAVIAVTETRGTGELVAFVVCRESAMADADSIRARLQTVCRERLPNYMCPHEWQFLDTLPTKVSGKTDRSALRERYRELAARPVQ